MMSADIHETPPELEDATARIEQAKHNYVSLEEELNRFLYDYVKGMVKGFDRESGNFVLQLRHHRESNVKGRSRVLVSQIVENLRTALDYMIFQLSVLTTIDSPVLSTMRWMGPLDGMRRNSTARD